MSFMRGNLLEKSRKLVKGLAMAEPVWLKEMEREPPVTFPRSENKLKPIILPEDDYVNKFFKKHTDSKLVDSINISGFDPPPARVFAWRVLELKEQGRAEEDAMAVADMEYRADKKAKRKAYRRLKEIAKLQGKKRPPNPFPSAVREIQAEEKNYIRDRFFDPQTLRVLNKLKQDRLQGMADRRGFI